jgi:hypothetical protein
MRSVIHVMISSFLSHMYRSMRVVSALEMQWYSVHLLGSIATIIEGCYSRVVGLNDLLQFKAGIGVGE